MSIEMVNGARNIASDERSAIASSNTDANLLPFIMADYDHLSSVIPAGFELESCVVRESHMVRGFLIISSLLLLGMKCLGGESDWKAPVDNRITESQVKTYLAAMDDWADRYGKLMNAITAARSPDERIAAAKALAQSHDDWLDAHRMSEAEFEFYNKQISDAWTVAMAQDRMEKINAEVKTQIVEAQRKLTDAENRLKAYTSAKKIGIRVLTIEQRNAAADAAKDDQQGALDETKQYAQDIKAAEDDARQQDATAAAAEASLANPPSDLAADDRQTFIDGKKSDIRAARDAAKSARDQEENVKKELAEAQARAVAAGRRIEHPEVPVTDEEKASAQSDDNNGIAAAQAEIDQYKAQIDGLVTMQKAMAASSNELARNVPRENVELMRKYGKQFEAVMTRLANPATQPSK